MIGDALAHILRSLADWVDPHRVSPKQLNEMKELAQARRMLETAEEQAEVMRLTGRLPMVSDPNAGSARVQHW